MSIVVKPILPSVADDTALQAAITAMEANKQEEASVRQSLAEAEKELADANHRLVEVSAQAVRGQIDAEGKGAVFEAKQAVNTAEAHQLAHAHALTAILKERKPLEVAVEEARHAAEVRVAGEMLAIERRMIADLVERLIAASVVEDVLESVQAEMQATFPEYHQNKEARRAMLHRSVEMPRLEAVNSRNLDTFFKHLVELGFIETKEGAN